MTKLIPKALPITALSTVAIKGVTMTLKQRLAELREELEAYQDEKSPLDPWETEAVRADIENDILKLMKLLEG